MSVDPGVTVSYFVTELKIMKAGKPLVPDKTTDTQTIQAAFKQFTTVKV